MDSIKDTIFQFIPSKFFYVDSQKKDWFLNALDNALKIFHRFTKEDLLRIYRIMYLSRKIDETMLKLVKQNRAHFHIGAAGHEAATLGAAINFDTNVDWAYPYYRDQPFVLFWGMTARELLLQYLAKKDDPGSGGRQLSQHFGYKDLRIISQSSPTGTQYLQGVGTAMGIKKDKKRAVVYVSGGEGTTSQGEFHEALNWASREKLPVVFHIENNNYAISTPITEQTAGGSVYKITAGYENLARHEIDGTNFFESARIFQRAVKRARDGQGPTVVVSNVVRLLPHTSSDDHSKYRTKDELEEITRLDPILLFTQICLKKDIFDEKELVQLQEEVDRSLEQDTAWSLEQPDPDARDALKFIYAENAGPLVYTSTGKEQRKGRIFIKNEKDEPESMIKAINIALCEEMGRNEKILIFGQDVADPKGGVFGATTGLTRKFGKDRVFNAPLAEASIMGTAIGLAVYGFKPVIEIQFMDYIWTAMMQIRNELAMMHYRSNGDFISDVVVRVPVGGYINGALYHSQTGDAFLTHMPGLRVVFPSNAQDAKGLLKQSIRMKDPVLFLEHKALYRSKLASSPHPLNDYTIPLGCANIVKEGEDITVITWGMQVYQTLEALSLINELNTSVEVIDLRTLNPLDMGTVIKSVKKTGKVLIVHEDTLTGGFGGEIAARIVEEAFEYLDGPIRRIGAKDAPVPYNTNQERMVLPKAETIARILKELALY